MRARHRDIRYLQHTAGISPKFSAEGGWRSFPFDVVVRMLKEWDPAFEVTQETLPVVYEFARDYLERRRPQLIAIGGLSGSGKSSVARALAPHIGAFPGAVHVRSDVERKRLLGVGELGRLPPAAYTAEVSDTVYTMCRKRALMALEGGHSVIVDAVHAKKEERVAVAGIAARTGAAFSGIWLDASPEAMRQRIAGRTGDASDATPAVLAEQLSYDIGPQTFAVVDAGRPLEAVVATCLDLTKSQT